MATAAPKLVNRAPEPRPAATVQRAQLAVSTPHDAAEREATQMAARIVRIPQAAVSPYAASVAAHIPARPTAIARQADGAPNVSANLAAEIAATRSSGAPLPATVRRFMEPRFKARFDQVRVHTDERAARLSAALGARAFTVGNRIYFGRNRFQPESGEGRELIAHELVHTVQQGAAAQAPAVRRSEDVAVRQRSEPVVQRLDLGLGFLDPTAYFSRKAAEAIPGFRFLTVVIGYNPITRESVDRSAANILRATVELLPGGFLVTRALDTYGIFDKVGAWVEKQFDVLRDIGKSIVENVKAFIAGLKATDIGDLEGVWNRGKALVAGPAAMVKSFAIGLYADIVKFVKDAVLKPLAAYAAGYPPYKILCGILGKDPITDAPVPQDPEALLGEFMVFVGEGEVWEKMQKAKAVPRAVAWFRGTVKALKEFVRAIPGLFSQFFASLELKDLLVVTSIFTKAYAVFGDFAGQFVKWGAKAAFDLLEIIFDVVAPGMMEYLKRTGAALKGILRDPMPFVGNLVNAAKLGFQNFSANFATHLKAGLLDWLVGALPGVYIPKAFTLPEFGKLVLSVLGITWAGIRAKIVAALGPSGEKIMAALEVAFDVIVALVKGGPAAAWEVIKEKLTNLKDIVVDAIVRYVVESVVKSAVGKIVAAFIPGAGFLDAIVSMYRTVQTFVAKLARIAQVVKSFVDSIVDIAGGVIAGAAKRIEMSLAGILSLAISFLASYLGLGDVASKVLDIVAKVRGMVDKGLDFAINWIVGKAKSLFAKLFGKDKDDRTPEQKQADLKAAMAKAQALQKKPGIREDEIRAGLEPIRKAHRLVSLTLVVESKSETKESVHCEGVVNPPDQTASSDIEPEGEGDMKQFSIPRPRNFDVTTADINEGVDVDLTATKQDRRHIISAKDMGDHYVEALVQEAKWSKAKKLLSDKGETNIAKLVKDQVPVEDAAKARHRRFFNDVENLFVGDLGTNRALRESVDVGLNRATGKRYMSEKEFLRRISNVEKRWTLTGNFKWTNDPRQSS